MLNGNPNRSQNALRPPMLNRGPLQPGHRDPLHMSGNQQTIGRMAPQPNQIGMGNGTNTTPRIQRPTGAPAQQYSPFTRRTQMPGYQRPMRPTGLPQPTRQQWPRSIIERYGY